MVAIENVAAFAGDTVVDALSRAPDNPSALIEPGGMSLSLGEFLQGAGHIAGQLASLGLESGTTAATVLPNGLASAQVYIGTLGAGRAAPINPKLTRREIADQLRGVDSSVVVTTPDRVDEMAALAGQQKVVAVEPADSGFSLTDHGRAVPTRQPDAVQADDGALVLMTSGTTGDPKRVSLSHANLLHAVGSIKATLGLTAEDCGLLLMPQFHIHGLQAGLLAPLIAGGRVVIPSRFQAVRVPGLCSAHQVSWYTAVPTMHGLIADRAAGGERAWTKSIRFTRSSSAAMPAALHGQVESLLEAPLLEAYGMTECAHQLASNPLPPGERVVGTVGAATGVEIRIADERDDGRGEVLVRGPSVITSYEGSGSDVNAVGFSDGWFHTGDEGRLDAAGRLTLTGRLKELINRGGEKIRPKEVEDVIATHPEVKEVAAFGIPHARLGEDVAVVIVPKGAPPSEREIREHARRDLAAFKVPQSIRFAAAIPRGATGKVQRSRLAEQLSAG